MRLSPACTRRRRSASWRATGSIGICAWWRGTTRCSSTPRRAIARFLAKYPNSDLTATARKLEERLRNRPDFAPPVVAATGPASVPQTVALAAPTCPCNTQPSSPSIRRSMCRRSSSASIPIRRSGPIASRRGALLPSPRMRWWWFAVRPRVVVYQPAPPPPVGIGIGIGIGGGGRYGGGNYGGGGYGGGGYGGRGRY